MDLLVIAKEPVPGRVKTRLCPPCDHQSAATIAEAALCDTLENALASGADRVLLALDGAQAQWCPPGVEVVDQGAGDFASRLSRAWSHASGPALQIGMDTPHIGPGELDAAMCNLIEPGVNAVLGPAVDGGWWSLGFLDIPDPPELIFAGIAMSRPDTGVRQLERLNAMGMRVHLLPTRCDADTWDDTRAIAATAPSTRFAGAVRSVEARLR